MEAQKARFWITRVMTQSVPETLVNFIFRGLDLIVPIFTVTKVVCAVRSIASALFVGPLKVIYECGGWLRQGLGAWGRLCFHLQRSIC